MQSEALDSENCYAASFHSPRALASLNASTYYVYRISPPWIIILPLASWKTVAPGAARYVESSLCLFHMPVWFKHIMSSLCNGLHLSRIVCPWRDIELTFYVRGYLEKLATHYVHALAHADLRALYPLGSGLALGRPWAIGELFASVKHD